EGGRQAGAYGGPVEGGIRRLENAAIGSRIDDRRVRRIHCDRERVFGSDAVIKAEPALSAVKAEPHAVIGGGPNTMIGVGWVNRDGANKRAIRCKSGARSSPVRAGIRGSEYSAAVSSGEKNAG